MALRRAIGDAARATTTLRAAAHSQSAAPPPADPRGGASPSNSGLIVREAELPPANRGPWRRARDPATGGHYWYNEVTRAATPVGAPKPDAWVRVAAAGSAQRQQQQQQFYWWNRHSGDTTAVGEPLPGPEGRALAAAPHSSGGSAGGSGGGGLVNLLGMPLAIGVGFGLFAGVLRALF